MSPRVRTSAFIGALIVGAACASGGGSGAAAAAPTTYVAPTTATIVLKSEKPDPQSSATNFFVENNSTVGITVTQFSLSTCQGLKQLCGDHRIDLHIGPGGRRQIFHVDPAGPNVAVAYRYNFRWKADSTTVAALGVLAGNGSADAAARLAAIRHQQELRARDTLHADKNLSNTELRALGLKIASVRAEPDTVVLAMGEPYFVPLLRIIALDSAGRPLGRWRGPTQFRVPGNGVVRFAAPDSLIPIRSGTTVVTVRTADVPGVVRGTLLNSVQFTLVVP